MNITYGVIAKCFYTIEKHEGYYSLYVIEEVPENFDVETIEQFLREHQNDGWSISGTIKEIMMEMKMLVEGR